MSSLIHSASRWVVAVTAAFALAAGVAGTALAAPGDAKTAETAAPIAVSSTPVPVSGMIAGDSGGSFAYYAYSYPGDSVLQTVTISIDSDNFEVANAVGVSLWLNGNEIGNLNALGEQPGTNSLTFSSTDTGQLLVQVWNYSDTTVNYTVTVTPASGS